MEGNIFEKPEYWCGDLGYRPPGYADFEINALKVAYILRQEPKTVLDIGCGAGYMVNRLRKAGIQAFGIDISAYAIQKLAPNSVKPYLILGSADNLPWPDQFFDMVVSFSVFEHLSTEILPRAISEAARVGKRGIIAVTPGDSPTFANDITHQTRQPLSWWKSQFPPEFEILNDADEEWLKTKQAELVKINLGSFVDTIGYGWENWDILPIQQHITPGHKFRQWDVRRGLPLANNSVDLYRISHLIEHLTLEEAKNLLREVNRTLKPGGFVRISTPDARLLINHYINHDMSFFNQIQPPEYIQAPTDGEKLSRILFSGDYSHKAIYDFQMLNSFLHQAGFAKIYQVSPGFSRSEVMARETQDQHIEVSVIVEAIK